MTCRVWSAIDYDEYRCAASQLEQFVCSPLLEINEVLIITTSSVIHPSTLPTEMELSADTPHQGRMHKSILANVNVLTSFWLLEFIVAFLAGYILVSVYQSAPIIGHTSLHLRMPYHDHSLSMLSSSNITPVSTPALRPKSAAAVQGSKPRLKGAQVAVAVVVPYRRRPEQLKVFVPALRAHLAKQDIMFEIYIIEQLGTSKFNRGSMMNIGFVESSRGKASDYYDCIVLHDVDLIPVIAENTYNCMEDKKESAIQISSVIDKDFNMIPAAEGGVNLVKANAFFHANGFSNRFFGWGGEDNDFGTRLRDVGFPMKRRAKELGQYRSLKTGHNRSPGQSDDRFKILDYTSKLRPLEGLTTLQYRLLSRTDEGTYTKVSIDMWPIEDPEYLS